MSKAARLDARYVPSKHPGAVLVAWAGPSLSMDMGGWTDHDADAFMKAIRSELSFGGGSLAVAKATLVAISAALADELGDEEHDAFLEGLEPELEFVHA